MFSKETSPLTELLIQWVKIPKILILDSTNKDLLGHMHTDLCDGFRDLWGLLGFSSIETAQRFLDTCSPECAGYQPVFFDNYQSFLNEGANIVALERAKQPETAKQPVLALDIRNEIPLQPLLSIQFFEVIERIHANPNADELFAPAEFLLNF